MPGWQPGRICLEVAKSMLFLGRRPLVNQASKRARLRQGVASSSSSALRRLRHGAAVAGDSTSSDDAGSGPEADWLIDDWPDRFMLKHTMNWDLCTAFRSLSMSLFSSSRQLFAWNHKASRISCH